MKDDIGITIGVMGAGVFLGLFLHARYGAKVNNAVNRVIGTGSTA